MLFRSGGGGVPVKLIPSLRRAINPLRDAASYRAIRRCLREFRPDVVHTHSAKGGVLGRIAAWSLRVPAIVHTVHGAPFHEYQSLLARKTFQICERYAAKRCHRMISVADAMTDLLVKAGIAPREKFTTVYSGMEVDPFLNSDIHRARMRRELGFTVRDHQGLVPAYTKPRPGQENIMRYQLQVHLDFYTEAAQSWFILKYL